MPFVERKAGAVVGLYNLKQPGYAEEFLPDASSEVVAFRQPKQKPEEKVREEFLKVPLATRDKFYDLMAKGAFALERGDTEYVAFLIEKAGALVDKGSPVEVALLDKVKQSFGVS